MFASTYLITHSSLILLSSHILPSRWELQMTAKSLKVAPRQVALVTGVPCTLLRMDRSGLYLAVGGSDGIVTVFATETFTRVRYTVNVFTASVTVWINMSFFVKMCGSFCFLSPFSRCKQFWITQYCNKNNVYFIFLFLVCRWVPILATTCLSLVWASHLLPSQSRWVWRQCSRAARQTEDSWWSKWEVSSNIILSLSNGWGLIMVVNAVQMSYSSSRLLDGVQSFHDCCSTPGLCAALPVFHQSVGCARQQQYPPTPLVRNNCCNSQH